MKVLMITPYITDTSISEFSRNKTGFGYMVIDIAKYISKKITVDLFAFESRGNTTYLGNVCVLKRSFFQLISSIYLTISFSSFLNICRKYKMNFGTQIRLFYCWLLTGYLSRILRSGKYDIVHIHDASFVTDFWIEVCNNLNIPFVITLHALKSFSDTVKLDSEGKRYERDFLSRAAHGEFTISVVGSGMKKLAEKASGVEFSDNIKVISNFCVFPDPPTMDFNLRKKYNIPKNSKIILCVGNISKRKNQGQLIRAFDLLEHNIAKDVYMMFIGGITNNNYTIELFKNQIHRKDQIIYCGVINKELLSFYYQQANAVALVSNSEAFGLSLLEGMHFGLPCLAFEDMDAFQDLYSEDVMVGVSQHTDESISLGLKELLTRKWDSNLISHFSEKFSCDSIVDRYIYLYKNLIRNA